METLLGLIWSLNFECLHKGHFRQINLAIRVTYELLEPITPGVSIPEYQKVVVRKQNEQGWFVVGPYQIWICNSSFAYSQGIRIKVTDWEINVSKPLDIIINCDIS